MDKNEIENLKENKYYWKVEKAALEGGITPEQGLEFINAYVNMPISDVFASEKAAKQAGISLEQALEFQKTYFLIVRQWNHLFMISRS